MLQSTDSDTHRRRNRRKNRSSSPAATAATAAVRSKAKSTKKPDPNAAKITHQCTECPRVFRSEKALHGHMRLHPEREWRGIIPPLCFRRRRPVSSSPYFPAGDSKRSSIAITDEEQDIADCLILLSNGPNLTIDRVSDLRFECSSCKKRFESQQALREHSGSYENAKRCFAIAKKSNEETEESSVNDELSMISTSSRVCGFVDLDLNLPAPVEEDASSSSYSSGFILDLRLGL